MSTYVLVAWSLCSSPLTMTQRITQRMARNLTDQVRSISEVTKAVARGDLSKMVQVDVQGEMLELKTTVNQMVSRLSTLAQEVTRVSLEVGTEGKLGGQAFVPEVQGMWKVRMFSTVQSFLLSITLRIEN